MKFHLTACVPKRPGASCLSVLKQRMGVRAVDLDLGEHRERHVVLLGAELADCSLVARLLMAELVARETEHGEAARAKAPVQRFEARVLRGEAALARDIDDEQRLAREIAERMRLAVDCLKRDVGGKGQGKLIGRCGFLMSLSRRGQQAQQNARPRTIADFAIEDVILEVQGGLSVSGLASNLRRTLPLFQGFSPWLQL